MGAEHKSALDKARTASRHNVLIGVKLRRPGETWFSSRVSNLSLEGFRLQSFVKLAPGIDIWIMLPGFEGRKARVTWARNHEAGCHFERPLHPAILDHILKTTQAESAEHPL